MAYVSSVLLLLFLSILGAVRANYFIDDANPIVQYTPDNLDHWCSFPSTVRYLRNSNGSALIMDYGRMYNGTVTWGGCNASQLCQISIPFTGSGITLFGGGAHTNFTVTLDGGRAHPPVLQTLPVSKSPYIYNVTLYDLQSVQMIPHLLTINLVPWGSTGYSMILFDSALINETAPATRTIPTSTPSRPLYLRLRHLLESARVLLNHVLCIALGTTIEVLALVIAVGHERLSVAVEQGRKQFRELVQKRDKYSKGLQAAERQAQENARALQQLQDEHLATIELLVSQGKLLESRTRELTVAQRFLTTTDSLPEADVIRIVSKLNDEILQCAAHLAESLSQTRFEPIQSDERDAVQTNVLELGVGIFELLKTFRTNVDPLACNALQIAFQTCFNHSCVHVIGSWHREERFENIFKGVYHELRQSASPSVAAKWRALTTANLDKLQERNESTFPDEVMEFLLTKMSAVSTIVGCPDIRPKLTNGMKNNLQWIAKSTLQLRTAVSQMISSSEMEVFHIPFGSKFDPSIMGDDFNGGCKDARSPAVVFCTTDLGLKSSRDVTNGQGARLVEAILLKPKVLLVSAVEDMFCINLTDIPSLPEDKIEFYCDS